MKNYIKITWIFGVLFLMAQTIQAQTVFPIIPGSQIGIGNDDTVLRNWLDDNGVAPSGTLLYRRSTHGASATTFHNLCDEKGPTLVLIKASNGQVFGGYTPNSWSSTNNGYKSSNQAFLFNLNSDRKATPYYPQNSIYTDQYRGPTFGGGHDIYINNTMNGGYFRPYSYNNIDGSGYAYNSNTAIKNLTGINTTSNYYYFYPGFITEIEVYQIEYNTSAPIIQGQDIAVVLDVNGNANITPQDIDTGTTDPDGPVTLSIDNSNFNCDNLGGNSAAITPTFIGTESQNTHSHGGGYNPNTQEFWYPQWDGTTVYRYDENHNLLGTFNSGQQQMMQLWMDTDSATDYYTANWGNRTITKRSGSNTIWTYNMGITAASVSADANFVYAYGVWENVIRVLDKDTGKFVRNITLPGNIYNYGGLVIANNNIYMAGYAVGWSTNSYNWNYLHQLDMDGNYISSTYFQIYPWNMAFDGETIWVSQNNSTIYGVKISEGNAYGSSGSNAVTLTATDPLGNSRSEAFSVTVEDNLAPTISLNGDASIDVIQGEIFTDPGAVAEDNCAAEVEVTGTVDVNTLGEYTLTYIAIDGSGNESESIERIVNVIPLDAIPPEVITKNIEIELDQNGAASILVSDIDNGTNDENGIASLELSQYNFDCSDVGNISTNTALNFDGIDDYIQLPGTWGGATELTIEAWVYVDGTTGDFQAIASSSDASYVHFQMHSGGNNVVYASPNTPVLPIIPATPTGSWKHVAMVVKSGDSRVYVNGNQVGSSVNSTFSSISSTNNLSLGRGNAGSRFLKGSIDEVRIWNIAKTNAEINANMNTALSGSETDLLAYYDFEDGAGSNVLTDKSGNGNDGTLMNMDASNDWVNGLTLFDTIGVPVILTATDVNGNEASNTAYVVVQDTTPPGLVCDPLTVDADEGVCEAYVLVTPPTVTENCISIGNALDFDGGDDFVTISTNPMLDLLSGWTLETWVNRDVSGSQDALIEKYNHAGGQGGYVLRISPSGRAQSFAILGSSNNSVIGTTHLDAGTWYHLAATFDPDANSLKVYVNGVLEGTNNTATVNTASTTNPIKLGCRGDDNNEKLNGTMDEVRIWDRAISPNEVLCSYNKLLSGTEPGLVVYYNFEDGEGSNTLADSSGNGNTGTLNNMDSATDWVTNNIPLLPYSLTNNITGTCDASGVYSVGITEIIWTATDANGNSNTCTQTIKVKDNENPVAVAQNITVELDVSGQASITPQDVDIGSTDNCGVQSISIDKTTFGCSDIASGASNFALDFDGVDDYVVAPNIGATSLNSFTVEAWVKTTQSGAYKRIISKPAGGGQNYSLALNNGKPHIRFDKIGGGGQQAEGLSSINDGNWHYLAGVHNTNLNSLILYVDGMPVANTITSGDPITSTENIYMGKFSSQYDGYFQGTVDEVRIWNIPRSASDILSNYNQSLNGNEAGLMAYYNFNEGAGTTVTDNTINTNNGTLTNMDPNTDWVGGAPLGTPITLTITDTDGNENTDTAVVTVEDNLPPDVVGKDIEVTLTASGTVSIVANDVLDTGSDNCGPVTYSISQDTFGAQDAIDSPVTIQLIGTDPSGNETSVPVIVTVIDPVPNAICKPITLYLDANGTATITPDDIDNGSNSVVGIGSLSLDIDTFGCENIGSNIVKLTVTSTLGATATCDATVMVEDKVVPVVATQDITVQLDATGNASITPAMIDFGSTDNCEIATYELDIDSFDCDDITGLLNTANKVVVTLTVTDIHGNVNSETATVTVEDKVVPVVATQDITVQLDATGNASITPAMIDFGSTDNCGIATYELDIDSFDCTDIQGLLNTNNTVVVTLTVTDIHGNVNSETATVTVEDKVVPVVATQDITVQLDATGNASITPAMIDFGSTDNCGIATYELDIDSFDCDDITGLLNTANKVVVTLTVTDIHGNVNSETATVTVEDKVVPVVATQDITVQLDATGNASITPAMIDFGSTDNCGIATYELDIDSFDCTDIQGLLNTNNTVVVTLTVTDIHGNVNSETATVTVEDKVVPVVATQDITVQLDATGNASITPAMIDFGSPDNCGIATYELDIDSFDCTDIQGLLNTNNTVVVTLTVTDIHGNVNSETATVTVEDKVVPVVATQDITVQLDATGNASITPAMIDFGSTDNCEIATYELDIDSFDCDDITGLLNTANKVVVTLTVTDIHGNVNSETATVTVEDKVVPVVATQDITVQLDATGNASITPAMIDFGSTDNCGIATYELDIDSFDCTDIQGLLNTNNTVVVTLTVTDIHGNVNSETATVTVEDKVVPVVATQDITVQLDATGNASITPAMIDFGSTDNCGIATYELDIDSFDCTDIQGLLNTNNTVVVTLTVTDIHGNVNSETATVTVEDKVVPVVATQDITVQLDATGNASITPAMIDFGSTDNCGIATYELDIDSFDCTDIQGLLNTNNTVVVTLTVTDIHGNVNSETATVTVEDKVVPVVATQDITVQLDATGNASITPAMIDFGSTDNCGIATYELDIDSFDCTDIQGLLNTNNTVVVTLTVTDIHGNVNSETATVTVEDKVVPVVATQDITVQLDATGNASITPAMIDFGSTDNCGIATYELDIDSFDCDDITGLLNTANKVVVTLTVTDIHGNVNSETATVTVEDKVVPVVATQDITVQLDATGNASITPAMIDFGSTDNCGIATYELDIDSFDCTDIQGLLNTNNTVVVTLTVTDIHGNVNSETATVTVEDKVVPVVATQDITVQLDATGNASITPAMIDFGSTDNCEIATYELDIDSFDCDDITGLLNTANKVVVTLTVTDIHGNVNSKTATVTVEDKVKPIITCAPNDSRYIDPYQTFYTVDGTEFNATATDACGIDSITYTGGSPSTNGSSMDGVLLSLGTNTMSWTALDVNGNDSNCTTIVEVIKRPTSLTYSGDVVEQYSDSVDLSATLTDDVSPGGGVQGKTITFTIGSQSTTAVTNASGVASTTLILTQDPANTYTVNAEFTEDASYLGSSANENFDITQEHAIVNYIGNEITATQSAYDLTATLDLRVSVQDLADGYRGDIRNATVSFVLDGTEILSPTPISQLVDPYTGVISLSHDVELSDNNLSETFTLEILVDGYYIASDQTVITVYVPTGEFITGGGHIIPTTSAGTYPSTAGTKTNFGFNVKFNKNGRKLKGKLNFIWRSNGRVYQAKSNATDALSVDITNEEAMTAVFTSKCNYSDITDPLYPISLGGNKIMHVSMTDRGEPGENDDISFTLWDGNELIYSSNWTGVNSIKQVLNGGNLVVHSGGSVGTTTRKAAEPVVEIVVEELFDGLELASWPNPSDDYFNLKLRSKNTVDKIYIQVFDLNNRLVSFRTGVPNRDYKIGATLEAGLYFVTVKQGNATKIVKLIKY